MDIVEVPIRPTFAVFARELLRRPQEYQLLVRTHLRVPGSYVETLSTIKGLLDRWGDSTGASWGNWTVSTTETRCSTDLPMGQVLVVRVEEGLETKQHVLVDVSVLAAGRWRKGKGPVGELESKVAEVSAVLEFWTHPVVRSQARIPPAPA
jgi:hypothetical protein